MTKVKKILYPNYSLTNFEIRVISPDTLFIKYIPEGRAVSSIGITNSLSIFVLASEITRPVTSAMLIKAEFPKSPLLTFT